MGIATTQNGAVQGAPAWFAIAIVFRRIRMGGSGPVVFVACGPSGPRCFCGVWAVRAPLFLWRVGRPGPVVFVACGPVYGGIVAFGFASASGAPCFTSGIGFSKSLRFSWRFWSFEKLPPPTEGRLRYASRVATCLLFVSPLFFCRGRRAACVVVVGCGASGLFCFCVMLSRLGEYCGDWARRLSGYQFLCSRG